MMKSKVKLLNLLNDNDRKIIYYCYKNVVVRYYGNKCEYLKEDLFSNAYICLLECYKNNYDIHKIFNHVKSSMCRFIRSIKNYSSINETLKDDEDSKSLNDYFSLITYVNDYETKLNIEYIKKCFFDCLDLFNEKERNLINDYILYKQDIKKILDKNNIALNSGGKKYLINLIRNFRKKLTLLLECFDIHTKNFLKIDEFSYNEQKYLRIYERKKQRKNNKEIYFNDVFIYSLMRDNYKKEYSKLLEVAEDKLKNIIYHTSCRCGKLFLKDIQLLRKNYFSEYSLDKLCEVLDVAG